MGKFMSGLGLSTGFRGLSTGGEGLGLNTEDEDGLGLLIRTSLYAFLCFLASRD